MGLSGREGGIGTDDVRYFAILTSGNISYVPLSNADSYPFTTFLSVLYPFEITKPLQILIPNLLGITFLPYFTYKFAFALVKNKQISNLSKKLILFCPFTMANGLILMRDIWITTFIIASLYFFIAGKYYHIILPFFLIAFIRFGSLVFLGSGLLILYRNNIKNYFDSKFTNVFYGFTIVAFITIFILIIPLLQELSEGRLENSLFRESFADILQSIALEDDVFIVKLMNLPLIPRTISLTLFFFFSPFLKFQMYTDELFNIRVIMFKLATPLLLCFCWSHIAKSFLFSFKYATHIRIILIIAIIWALSLGTFSLQIRHKTILMPLIYILTAYGYFMHTRRYNTISFCIVGLIIAVQLYFAL
jgi:hypothetical protein